MRGYFHCVILRSDCKSRRENLCFDRQTCSGWRDSHGRAYARPRSDRVVMLSPDVSHSLDMTLRVLSPPTRFLTYGLPPSRLGRKSKLFLLSTCRRFTPLRYVQNDKSRDNAPPRDTGQSLPRPTWSAINRATQVPSEEGIYAASLCDLLRRDCFGGSAIRKRLHSPVAAVRGGSELYNGASRRFVVDTLFSLLCRRAIYVTQFVSHICMLA